MHTRQDISPFDPALTTVPIKTFFIEQRWREAAVINAILDFGGGETSVQRDGVLFLAPLGNKEVAYVTLPAKDIVAKAKTGDFLPAFQGVEITNGSLNFPLGIVDIVTYPFYFALINGVDIAHDSDLMRINHELVYPYLKRLSDIASVLTIPHYNEEPIDDAPTHNLICYETKAVMAALQKVSRQHLSEECLRRSIQSQMNQDAMELVAGAVNSICVCGENPIMDDRYVYMERRDCDGRKKELCDLKW